MMTLRVHVDPPVAGLGRSRAAVEALGPSFNVTCSDETALGMEINGASSAMFLNQDKYASVMRKSIAAARQTTAMSIALQLRSRAAVDAAFDKAAAHGGGEARRASEHGFVRQRAFEDPDGHTRELFWMDPAHKPGPPHIEA